MPSSEPDAAEQLAALEREVQALRTSQAEVERERAAITLERAAIDDERVGWIEERGRLGEECRRLQLESAQHEQALAAAQQDRLALEGVLERERNGWAQERRALEDRIAAQQRALRWCPRHWIGMLAHRSETVRRLRAGRGPGSSG